MSDRQSGAESRPRSINIARVTVPGKPSEVEATLTGLSAKAMNALFSELLMTSDSLIGVSKERGVLSVMEVPTLPRWLRHELADDDVVLTLRQTTLDDNSSSITVARHFADTADTETWLTESSCRRYEQLAQAMGRELAGMNRERFANAAHLG